MSRLARIAISIGDPAGVGAEIALKALQDQIRRLARAAGFSLPIRPRSMPRAASAASTPARCPALSSEPAPWPPITIIAFGQLRAEYGVAAIAYVRRAVELCMSGEADAMVTAPLNKEAVTLSGHAFSGHTEYIAELTGAPEPRMLLYSEKLATVHVSTHISLEQACHLDRARIVRTIQLGNDALLWMRRQRAAHRRLRPQSSCRRAWPLWPQDAEIIAPAIAEARALGIDCSGPHSPDTIFIRALRGEFDLIVAMYHDQGHIPMKLIDFEGGVNVSLGPAHHPHLRRSRHRLRYRRPQPGRRHQHEGRHASRRPHGRGQARSRRANLPALRRSLAANPAHTGGAR